LINNKIFISLMHIGIITIFMGTCGCSSFNRNINAAIWIGGFAHEFEPAAEIIKTEILGDLTDNEIEIVHDGSFLDSPYAAQLDVIVMHHCFQTDKGVLTDSQRQKLIDLVCNGVGVVAIHASYYSFPEWADVHDIYGARWIDHGPVDVTLNICTVDDQHPIMRNVDPSFEVVSELYRSTPLANDCHVLANAREKNSDKIEPSVWIRKYGKGRVVTILPGHGPDAFKVPNFQKIIAQSTLWAAGRLENN